MGSQSKEDGEIYKRYKNLPRLPDIKWYGEYLEKIIVEVKSRTKARIGLITLPWVGE